MSETFNYTPPHYKLEKYIPPTPVMDEVEQLVNESFGNDYEHDIEILNSERLHAAGCGCGKCQSLYEEHLVSVARKYIPNE